MLYYGNKQLLVLDQCQIKLKRVPDRYFGAKEKERDKSPSPTV